MGGGREGKGKRDRRGRGIEWDIELTYQFISSKIGKALRTCYYSPPHTHKFILTACNDIQRGDQHTGEEEGPYRYQILRLVRLEGQSDLSSE